jgi:hypothetical protein
VLPAAALVSSCRAASRCAIAMDRLKPPIAVTPVAVPLLGSTLLLARQSLLAVAAAGQYGCFKAATLRGFLLACERPPGGCIAPQDRTRSTA